MNKLLITTMLTCTFTSGFANSSEHLNPAESSHGFMFGLGQANFDKQVAIENGIDDSALSIRLGYEYRKTDYIFAGGITGLVYDDSDEFNQTVIDQFGNVSTAESSADAFGFYVEGGYEYPINSYAYADFMGGYEQIFSSSRSISNCSNCIDQDIDVDAGLYINPRLSVILDNSVFFSLGYQHYLGGDIENNIMLSIGMGARQH